MYIEVLQKRYANVRMMPILSWDVLAMSLAASQKQTGDRVDRSYFDRMHLYALAKTNNWKLGIDIDKELSVPGNTIVVTNLQEEIQYATAGFLEMTGYHPYEAIGKRPAQLLQGADTSLETKKAIRESISRLQPCTATLVNYRKNGEPYFCKVSISPVFDIYDRHVAFVAVECEVEDEAA